MRGEWNRDSKRQTTTFRRPMGGNRSGRARDGGRVGSRLGVVGANQYDSDDDSVVSFSDDAMDIDNIANPNEF